MKKNLSQGGGCKNGGQMINANSNRESDSGQGGKGDMKEGEGGIIAERGRGKGGIKGEEGVRGGSGE